MKGNISSPVKIFEFDFLRALAIIMLMFHHSDAYALSLFGFSLQNFAPYFEAILLGLFFFISGYFAAQSFQKNKQSGTSFFLSRVMRIFPPYLFALFLYMFLMEISFKKKDLIIYLLGTQFLFTPNFTKPVVTIWFVSAILIFYLIFGVLLANTRSIKELIVGTGLIFAGTYVLHLWTGLIDERFYKYFIVFLIGVLFSRLTSLSKTLSGEQILIKFVIAVLSTNIFSFVINLKSISPFYIFGVVFFIVSWTVLLFALTTKIKSPFIVKAAALVSYSSFFVYLLHRPIWHWLVRVFSIESSHDQILFRLFPAFLVVFILSYFLQNGYDRLLGAVRGTK